MVLPVHDIPGRLRFALPGIRGDRRAAAILRARIRAIAGIGHAAANPVTGSLIVRYDGSPLTRERILAGIEAFDADRRRPAFAARPWSGIATEILAEAVAERIIEVALRAAVAAVI